MFLDYMLRTTRRSREGAARGGGTPSSTSKAGRSAERSGTLLLTKSVLKNSTKVIKEGCE
eukprot:768199-Hanusia_phi.AAC.2